ncbi:MAG TPA: heme ABC exporter ATP-binding protein CcmA [Actinomycetota bacterium]|nr:heme ABC exporter ATP-binding protein CcmA [Actinomycetota bacterium]
MKTVETVAPSRNLGPRPGTPAIELTGVSRLYGYRPALVRVDLRVEAGEVLLVRGSNGAGKSTLLRILATALPVTEGEGRLHGFDLRTERAAIRRRVEYVGHATRLYEDLTGAENLRFVARLWGIARPPIDRALAEVGLLEAAALRVATYSQGMRQRLALARIVLRDPDLLLLDEPFAALDAAARDALEVTLGAATRRGATVVLVSHDHYADALATRTVDLTHGRIVRDVAARPSEAAL